MENSWDSLSPCWLLLVVLQQPFLLLHLLQHKQLQNFRQQRDLGILSLVDDVRQQQLLLDNL